MTYWKIVKTVANRAESIRVGTIGKGTLTYFYFFVNSKVLYSQGTSYAACLLEQLASLMIRFGHFILNLNAF